MTAPIEWKLQGSAATLDGLVALIKSRWSWSVVHIDPTAEEGVFTVSHANGPATRLRVIRQRGRYRLEVQQ